MCSKRVINTAASKKRLKETAVIGQMISEICLKRRSDYQILFPGKRASNVNTVDKVRKRGKTERVK